MLYGWKKHEITGWFSGKTETHSCRICGQATRRYGEICNKCMEEEDEVLECTVVCGASRSTGMIKMENEL